MSEPRFTKIHIEISNICNLQCSFCPEVKRTSGFMDVGLFARIIEEVAPLTEQVAFHLMGDPSVHPELARLVALCHEKNVRINFVTNGVLLRDELCELLLHPAFRQVNFSLHSFPDNFGEKDPTLYLERIFRFTERALKERADLYVNFRLWDLSEMRSKLSKHREMLKQIEDRFQVEIARDMDIRRKKGRVLKGRLYLHFDTQFIWPDLNLPVLGSRGTCHGLSTHFGILVDGTVVPCCLDKEGAIPLGNINSNSILEILAGPRAEALLNGFRKRQLVEALCQRCQYIERFRRPAEKSQAPSDSFAS